MSLALTADRLAEEAAARQRLAQMHAKADAERDAREAKGKAALASVNGNVDALLARVMDAGASAWERSRSPVLSRDQKNVRAQVVALMRPPVGPPKPLEAAAILAEAEARWSAIPRENFNDPLAAMVRNGTPVVVAPPSPTAAQIISRLHARGIGLALTPAGRITALNAQALNDSDRALVREHAEELKLALGTQEILA
jgi:hypothetical protein